jgi:hypothetical protein
VIVIGLLALILNALLLDFVFFLVMLLFPGNPRNNTLFLALLLKQNIDLWLLVLVILLSYFLSFMIYTFLILNQLYYSVTVKRDKIQGGLLRTMHITTQHQIADIFTKALGRIPFEHLLSKMNILNIYSS